MVSPIDNDPESPLPLGFTEFKESGQENYDFKEGKADFIRIFDGPWENRQEFLFNHVLPVVTEANGTTIYSSPNVYPEYTWARAYKAEIKGLLKTDKTEQNFIKHTMARITVHYSTPDFIDDSGNNGGNRPPGSNDRIYVVETVDSETEIYPLPARKFQTCYHMDRGICYPQDGGESFVAGKATELGKIPYRLNRFIYKLKLPLVINPRWADIDFSLGGVNYIPFVTPSGLYAPPGTLRYDGISSVTKRELTVGALVWEMEHKFTYYKPGWNTFPDVDDTGTKIVHKRLTPPLYHNAVHQRIFIDIANNIVERAADHFENQPAEAKDRFFVPERENALSQNEVRTNFINNPDTVNIFI